MVRRASVLAVVCLFTSLPMFGLTFTVINTNDSGAGSLRDAITLANGNPGSDTIVFNIPAAGVQTIPLATPLPLITDPVLIDGYTQPGASPNTLIGASDAVILIALQGQAAFVGPSFSATADDSTIRGLSIGSFLVGLSITGATNVSVMGNFLGITPSDGPFGNDVGILIGGGASACNVGSNNFADRNVISGNATGIALGSDNNFIINNLIGTNSLGATAAPNRTGIRLLSASSNFVSSNLISGNNVSASSCGIQIDGASSSNTIVTNDIGLNVNGNAGIPNETAICIFDDNISAPAFNDIKLNRIRFNDQGIVVTTSTIDPIGNKFDRNSFGNISGVPIDLKGDGVTANDPGDGDTGPNHLLNYPVITSAVASGGQLTITGTLDVPPGTGMHTIDFYHAAFLDVSGIAQGAPIAQTTVNAGAGPQPFTHTFPWPGTTGVISATAYSSILFETSEVSQGVSVTVPVTPEVSIANASKTEGIAGTSTMVFLVTMSATSASDVQVNYATTDGSATAPSDYAATSGTLTIPAGSGGGTILVPINGDSTIEADETFTVTLSSPQNATLDDFTAVGTITNDDVPSISIADVSVVEGNSGTNDVSVVVTLSQTSSSDVLMNFGTISGTAAAPSDFTSTTGLLTIPAGSTSGTILVPIVGDALIEPDETFQVALVTPQNATFYDDVAVVTITNDDGTPVPDVTIADASIVEGNAGTSNLSLTVTLSAPSASDVQVSYAALDGTAIATLDYNFTNGTLTIPAGSATGTIVASILGDTNVEPDETFTVTLYAPQNATISDSIATATITNDDVAAPPSLTIGDASVLEGNGGSNLLSITVTLSAPSASNVHVNYTTVDGTASAPGDYTATNGTLTILAGGTNGTIVIPVAGDMTFESDETFSVTLAAPQNATISDGTATVTISNDDAAAAVPIPTTSEIGLALLAIAIGFFAVVRLR